MNLTLRKARRLERSILERIDQENSGTISFSVFSDTPDLEEAENGFIAELKNKLELNQIRYNIRAQIDEVNFKSGLNALIGKEASLKARIRLLNLHLDVELRALTQQQLSKKHEINTQKAEALETRNNFFSSEELEASFISTGSKEWISKQLLETNTLRQDVADEMLDINMNSIVIVSVEDLKVLKGLELL